MTRQFHIGAQNDALFIISGERPATTNDYPRHDADRTCIAKVYDKAEARRLVDAANAGLASAPQASQPPQGASSLLPGWKLVPVEPTEKMLDAAWPAYIEAANNVGSGLDFEPHDGYRSLWAAMLAASPLPAPQEPAALHWISVYDRIPQYQAGEDGERVLVLTNDHDFAGVKVHDVPVSDFYAHDPDDDEPGTEVTKLATHWMPLPPLYAAQACDSDACDQSQTTAFARAVIAADRALREQGR